MMQITMTLKILAEQRWIIIGNKNWVFDKWNNHNKASNNNNNNYER